MELRGASGDERGTTSQELIGLSITWPQATNGNLNNIKFGGTTIYNTPTGGGSLSTSSLLGTTAQRTFEAGKSQTLQFSFQNHVDTNASPLHCFGHVQSVWQRFAEWARHTI
jgi:hypothetical protein